MNQMTNTWTNENPVCRTCGRKFMGASWLGRCFQCHNDSLVPYESGEDYIGWER